MDTTIVGFPRIGAQRELKFACESYFRGETTREALEETARELRLSRLRAQKGLTLPVSGDFSYYDRMLDTAVLLGAVPKRYKALSLPALDTYFAMAHGYQGTKGDVKALPMKKWFNTNYHYIVPELEDDCTPTLAAAAPLDAFEEAIAAGIVTKPTLIGPYTFLSLAHCPGERVPADFADAVAAVYGELVKKLAAAGARWIAIEEPQLVRDTQKEDFAFFAKLYEQILPRRGDANILLQTYFGDVRDCYEALVQMDFQGIGLDFCEGKETLRLVRKYGFPQDKTLFAGVINGKNIWRNHYKNTLDILNKLQGSAVVLNTSCSLLHVPYSLEYETRLPAEKKRYFAFAHEKLEELRELEQLTQRENPAESDVYQKNFALFSSPRVDAENQAVRDRAAALKPDDFVRHPDFDTREQLQKKKLRLPLLPTTTIGSFPQTSDVRKTRRAYRRGELSEADYKAFLRQKIAGCIEEQERLGLDVLVHGEFERGDMVEYFGENLDGFLFTENGWVQSYGTRGVKPPIIWGDVSRTRPITVEWSTYAQSQTKKPMKAMLTGPVTILNWSFPREDISLGDSCVQIALALRDEVLDLERAGMGIIQIDEAALREKLPLRRQDWKTEYLDWAVPAFRLVHSAVKPDTQIHTHMCYSEFGDIIHEIEDMDADVITFEASRSDLAILDVLQIRTEPGPGVYDIHSPRVPSVEEIKTALEKMLRKIPKEKLWVNPDCGLKTRGEKEVRASLANMVQAAHDVRKEIE